MSTRKALESLLQDINKRFPNDRFVPGVVIAFLPGERNDKNRRVMDGTNKKYRVPAGKSCFYGSIKRFFGGDDEIVLTFKGKSILEVVVGLSKELEKHYGKG